MGLENILRNSGNNFFLKGEKFREILKDCHDREEACLIFEIYNTIEDVCNEKNEIDSLYYFAESAFNEFSLYAGEEGLYKTFLNMINNHLELIKPLEKNELFNIFEITNHIVDYASGLDSLPSYFAMKNAKDVIDVLFKNYISIKLKKPKNALSLLANLKNTISRETKKFIKIRDSFNSIKELIYHFGEDNYANGRYR